MALPFSGLDSVSHYLVLKTAISVVTGLVAWGMLELLAAQLGLLPTRWNIGLKKVVLIRMVQVSV